MKVVFHLLVHAEEYLNFYVFLHIFIMYQRECIWKEILSFFLHPWYDVTIYLLRCKSNLLSKLFSPAIYNTKSVFQG